VTDPRRPDTWHIVEFDRGAGRLRAAAAQMLVDEFREFWPDAWPGIESAVAEVEEALSHENVAFAALAPAADELIGWIGARPLYSGHVWELHPLVVRGPDRGRGIGRSLVQRLEQELVRRGGLTLWVGTDDEASLTSLGGVDVYPGVLEKLARIENLRRHPLGFYRALGFELAGIVPDANGFGKPDLLMARRIGAGPAARAAAAPARAERRQRIWFQREFESGLSPEVVPDVLERLRGTPLRVEQRVASVAPDIRTRRSGGGWSVQEHAGHLLDLEPLWAGRLDDFEAGATTLRPADLTNRATWEADHNARPLAEILEAFRTRRGNLVARVEAMSEAELRRTALHPRLQQPMTVVDLLFFVAEHDDHRLASITRLLPH
jgi:aminoglycoside 6'-N-acetyltransferase I